MLTGKYAKAGASGGRLDDAQLAAGFSGVDERKRAVAQSVADVAKRVGRSPAQVAMAWLRQRDVPVIPIVGSRKLDQSTRMTASASTNGVSRSALGESPLSSAPSHG